MARSMKSWLRWLQQNQIFPESSQAGDTLSAGLTVQQAIHLLLKVITAQAVTPQGLQGNVWTLMQQTFMPEEKKTSNIHRNNIQQIVANVNCLYLHDQLVCSWHKFHTIAVIKRLRYVLAKSVTGTSWRNAPSTTIIRVWPQQVAHWTLHIALKHCSNMLNYEQQNQLTSNDWL